MSKVTNVIILQHSHKDVLRPCNGSLQNITNRTPTPNSRVVKSSPKTQFSSPSFASTRSVMRNYPKGSPLKPIRPSPSRKVSPIIKTEIVSYPSPTSSIGSSSCSLDSSNISGNISPAPSKRKLDYQSGQPVPLLTKRNARERNRVKQVSQGFAALRQHVPQAARKKKLSKVETLRCAVEYIRGLQLLLEDNPTIAPLQERSPTQHEYQHQQQVLDSHILKVPTYDDRFSHHQMILRYDNAAENAAYSRASPSVEVPPTHAAHTPIPVNLSCPTPGVDVRTYIKEEQDLLEALAWWQHNVC